MSESMFKGSDKVDPLFALFIYSISTQIIAAFLLLFREPYPERLPLNIDYKRIRNGRNVILLNVYTLLAFVTYFYAIRSPIGASLNSFVDYGLGPLLTGVAGALLVNERLDIRFIFLNFSSLLGVLLMVVSQNGANWSLSIFGLTFALLSCSFSVCYRIIFKDMLNKGHSKSWIVLSRLTATTLFTGVISYINQNLYEINIILKLFATGLVGFTLPLFISLFILQNISLKKFGSFLFMLPVATYIGSLIAGNSTLNICSLVGASIVIGSVVLQKLRDGLTPIESTAVTHPSSTPQ